MTKKESGAVWPIAIVVCLCLVFVLILFPSEIQGFLGLPISR